MEMTYNYFKCLHSFAFENKDKKHDVVFVPDNLIIGKQEYPLAHKNPILTFHKIGDVYKSDSTPIISFEDIFELWGKIGQEIECKLLPSTNTTCKWFNINGQLYLCLRDYIEVWEEEQVKVEEFFLNYAKSIKITTPKGRG